MKRKLSLYNIAAAAAWILCMGFIGADIVLSGGSRDVVFEQAQRALQESQEKLAFAQSAGKEETKRRAFERLTQIQESLNTFTCPAAEESALIFQVGQLAHTLELKRFISRVPSTPPAATLEKSDHITEGWLSVEFVADYLKTAAFINSLERHEPVLFIESVHLTRSDENKSEAAVRINLSYLIRKSSKTAAVAQADADR